MKIDRPNIDIQPFAGSSKTEERTAFGSKEITDNLEKNLNADFARGWGIVPVSELPTMQDFNAVGFTISSLVTHLYQNGIAEYAEKQIYNKGAVCLSEGNIYISKTENNAGNPVTDTTQWQSLKDAILGANIVQQLGNATDKVISQKSVTDALNTKQAKGDYATKTELTQGLNTKLNSAAVKQTTGNSTTDVISQKACDDNYAKKTSGDPLKVGRLNVESATGDTIFNLGGTNGSAGSEFAYVKNSKRTQVRDTNTKTTVLFPQKSGEIALTSDVEAIDNYPVGAPIPWPQATPPVGYLVCNGQTFNKTTCPQLATVYPSGKLPDLQGQFIRGLDLGGKVDKGRAALSTQGDAIRNMRGSYVQRAGSDQADKVTYPNITNAKGVFRSVLNKTSGFHTLGIVNPTAEEMVNFDASFEVPTANENRPKNIAFLYIVRAA
ncbi:phage tail protein [Arsenophonus nasoniae]|uniref:Phage tail protein n=1 Tax=Arsenophonus nasoniae TaxID=638 RepID=A0AA95GW87_9GAMM|nr:phage tail protein [Arsenophonus nasoniae]WGM03914.1 phage tail protein [Arsenophonus nasoniae]